MSVTPLLNHLSHFALSGETFALLSPAGSVAQSERHLMFFAIGLMLVIVIPVFILTILIAIHYREGNTKAKFTPNWDHNRIEEFIWWGVPIAVIAVIAVVTWKSSHALDPYRPLESDVAPITVEVVALDWKWLFLYPSEGIATLNYLEIPAETPIAFKVTADAPMNSFWIPQLSGQIYAMPGMVTQLHIIADHPGTYQGLSSNFSGKGFADMTFKTNAVSKVAFENWVTMVKQTSPKLDDDLYTNLSKPSVANPPARFVLGNARLFNDIVTKYMVPGNMDTMNDMDMSGNTEDMQNTSSMSMTRTMEGMGNK